MQSPINRPIWSHCWEHSLKGEVGITVWLYRIRSSNVLAENTQLQGKYQFTSGWPPVWIDLTKQVNLLLFNKIIIKTGGQLYPNTSPCKWVFSIQSLTRAHTHTLSLSLSHLRMHDTFLRLVRAKNLSQFSFLHCFEWQCSIHCAKQNKTRDQLSPAFDVPRSNK